MFKRGICCFGYCRAFPLERENGVVAVQWSWGIGIWVCAPACSCALQAVAEGVRAMVAWCCCDCELWVHPTPELWHWGLEVNFHMPVFPFVWQKGCEMFISSWHSPSAAISLYHCSYCSELQGNAEGTVSIIFFLRKLLNSQGFSLNDWCISRVVAWVWPKTEGYVLIKSPVRIKT